MADSLESAPADRVYVELDWHDGPRSGVAGLFGVPHRFESVYDPTRGEYSDYLLVPVDRETLALELEQSAIVWRWLEAVGAGLAGPEDHPSNPGVDARWAELESLLAPRRTIDPTRARRAEGTVVGLAEGPEPSPWPGYAIRWRLLGA